MATSSALLICATTGSAVSNSSAQEIQVNQGGANFTYNGTVTNTVGGAIIVTGRTGGTVDFQGNITSTNAANNAAATAIIVGTISVGQNNSGGTVRFSGGTKTLNSSTATAVSAVNNTGATVEFTNGGLDIDTTSGNGFVASGGGTINVTGANNNLDTNTGTALTLNGVSAGASNGSQRPLWMRAARSARHCLAAVTSRD